MRVLSEISTTDVYFRKHTRFRPQLEYRWVWSTSRDVGGALTINIPEARRLCDPWYLDGTAKARGRDIA